MKVVIIITFCLRAGAIAQRLWGLGPLFDTAEFSSNNRISNDSKPSSYYSLNQPQTIRVDSNQSRLLYASFAWFRFYLANFLDVSAAPLVFHFTEKRTSRSAEFMRSVEVTDEIEALR